MENAESNLSLEWPIVKNIENNGGSVLEYLLIGEKRIYIPFDHITGIESYATDETGMMKIQINVYHGHHKFKVHHTLWAFVRKGILSNLNQRRLHIATNPNAR